ncbi:MAG TPA: hypothetical protein VML75_03990, partial [Kofleriaceae bacterium]|nr:hypothetical protein [Kofleriaceae bacterium]
MDEFDLELLVEELEAKLGALVRDQVRGQWDAARSGRAAPRWPVELGAGHWTERCARAMTAADPALRARAAQLWRHALRARVHADPGVAAATARAEGEVGGLIALAGARNQVARAHGFAHFGALVIAVEGATEPAGIAPPPPPAAAMPAAAGVAQALAWLQGLGIDAGGARWVLAPGATPRTYVVDPPADVRVMAAPPRTGGQWHSLLHEAGHAWLAATHAPDLPWSLRDAPTRLMHEAVAEWVGGAAASEAFGVQVLGLPVEDARAWAVHRREAGRVAVRRRRARAADEWRLYRDLTDPGAATWSAAARR